MAALYKQFNHAQQQLNNIEAIDYFFAKEIQQSLVDSEKYISSRDTQQVFHLLIALSESLRAGHSCLPLSIIANTRFGYSCDKQGIITHHGFTFTELPMLVELCKQLSVGKLDNQAIVFHDKKVYLRRYFNFEQELLNFISTKNTPENDPSIQAFNAIEIKSCLDALFPSMQLEHE